MNPMNSDNPFGPAAKLTSAQEAALQNVLQNSRAVFEPPKQPEKHKPVAPQPQMQHRDEMQPQAINLTYKKAEEQVRPLDITLQFAQSSTQNKKAPPKKKQSRSRIHLDRQKSVTIVLVLFFVLAALLFGGWYVCGRGDSKPPTADPVEVTIKIGESVVPGDFVENIFDDSEIVSVEFVERPDVFAHENQNVNIRITDEHGNFAVFTSKLIILINTEPPVIEGVQPITSTLGNPILYRAGVTAHDDFGRELEFHVDTSGVDQYVVGEYTVIYSARDQTGLETRIYETVEILEVDIDFVRDSIDAILDEIIESNMTQLEMVKAIHTWVRTNIAYASVRTDPENVYEDAYRALRDRRGNCFNFYAVSELMLGRSGIPNMPIQRIDGTETRHRWSLINPDDLGWHHFDTVPTRLQLGGQTAFFTETQARDFTSRMQELTGTRNYYTYDPELYPEIVQ